MKETYKEKPFVFVIGAQKSGTTTLHNLLLSHEEISLPEIKETHFFSYTDLYQKGISWYMGHFKLNKKTMCEVDPSYLFFPKCAERINESIVSPKFIIIFRRPLERAFSHYLMSCYRGHEELPFIDAIKNEKKRLKSNRDKFSFIHHSYLERGNYVCQLDRYVSIFNKSNFLFIKFDDLINIPRNKDLLKSICQFMDVDYRLLDTELPQSNSKKKVKSIMVRDLLYKETFFKKVIKLAVPSDKWRNRIKGTVNSFNSSNYSNEASKHELIKNIEVLPEEYFNWSNEQTRALSEISNLNLDDWIYN